MSQRDRAGESVWVSESLDDPSSAAAALRLWRVDVPQDPRLPCTPPIGPTDRLRDLYCVIINETWCEQQFQMVWSHGLRKDVITRPPGPSYQPLTRGHSSTTSSPAPGPPSTT